MTYANSKDQYLQNAVLSASPTRLLIMLYDRLLLDVQRAERVIGAGAPMEAGPHLLHAQDIVTELTNTLKVDGWAGALQLQALYLFLYSELVDANVSKDLADIAECRELITELRDTWYQAANLLGDGTEMAAANSSASLAVTPVSGEKNLVGAAGARRPGLGDLGVG